MTGGQRSQQEWRFQCEQEVVVISTALSTSAQHCHYEQGRDCSKKGAHSKRATVLHRCHLVHLGAYTQMLWAMHVGLFRVASHLLQ